jgi:hypothetical protein
MTVENLNVQPLPESEVGWVNASGVDDRVIQGGVEKIGREVSKWIESQRASRQKMSMFDRSSYVAPDNPYGQMEIARRAVENDDVVGGVADVTEGLAFQGMEWEGDDADDADVFNQISRDLDLDKVVRTWWREEFTYSQVVMGMWWGQKEYTVRGYAPPKEEALVKVPGDPLMGTVDGFEEPRDPDTNRPIKPKRGPKRKKKYNIWCPTGVTFLDPMRVVPVGSGMFGEDRLAWQATEGEITAFKRVMDGTRFDPIMERFFIAPYIPSQDEAHSLEAMGIDTRRLLELNPEFVFRHTVTTPDYRRFADVRLKGTFSLLDLKTQLMEADRVMLVGAANYILLIKKGEKDDPALPAELSNLKDNFQVLAKLPVIISDHRLSVEIITPAQDSVLTSEKYDTIDRRILNRALGSLTVTGSGQRNESTLTVARGVARLLESRRLMIKRELEKRIARTVVEHPSNKGKFEDEPNIAFIPRNVQLDSDAQVVQAVMSLRTQRELSRGSILEFFGFDQEVEAQRRLNEEESGMDAIFGSMVPFSSPQMDGAQGGRPMGGGQSPQSVQGNVKPKTSTNAPSTKKPS